MEVTNAWLSCTAGKAHALRSVFAARLFSAVGLLEVNSTGTQKFDVRLFVAAGEVRDLQDLAQSLIGADLTHLPRPILNIGGGSRYVSGRL